MWIGQREIGVMAAVVPEICVRLGIIDAVGGIPRYLSAALTSLLEAEVHGDGDEIAAVPLDGFDLDARGRGPGERQERDQRRQNPRARHGGDRARALLRGWENPRPQSALLVKSIRGDRSRTQLCFKRRGAFEGHSDGRFSVMADLASAKKTLDGLVKAYAAGDAAKTASLIGTLKVRAPRSRAR